MKPINPNKPVHIDIDGVRYFATPPVGEAEILVLEAMEGPRKQVSAIYAVAKKELDKELKNKRPIKDADYQKRLRARVAKKTAEQDTDVRFAVNQFNAVVDAVLVGWESTNGEKLEAFPGDGRPSIMLGISTKKRLYDWYFDLFQLGEDESKN